MNQRFRHAGSVGLHLSSAGQAVVHDQDGVKFRGERHGLTFAESELGAWH